MALPTGTLRELALYAGSGGGILASILLGHQIICAVEIEPYCREVLLRRQWDGVLPLFPIWDDARTFNGEPWRGVVDIITAGFPCQPFSVAGRRQGEADERNLWPDTIRIIREVRPRHVLLENVPGLLAAPHETLYGEPLPIEEGTIIDESFKVEALMGGCDIILPSYVGRIFADLAESGFDGPWRVLSAAGVGAPHQRDRLWIVADAAGL